MRVNKIKLSIFDMKCITKLQSEVQKINNVKHVSLLQSHKNKVRHCRYFAAAQNVCVLHFAYLFLAPQPLDTQKKLLYDLLQQRNYQT